MFIFMPRTPELYFSLLGILKTGAVAGPCSRRSWRRRLRTVWRIAEPWRW